GKGGRAWEDEVRVLGDRLRSRHAVDRRVVDGVDGDGHHLRVAERTAGSGVAVVVRRDGQRVGTAVVRVRRVGQAVERDVEIGERAAGADARRAVAADREAGGG